VKALVHAELIKLRSTRMTLVLLLATLGLVILTIEVNVPDVGAENEAFSLDDRGLLAGVVGVGFGTPWY
jgi:hypothetical protein